MNTSPLMLVALALLCGPAAAQDNPVTQTGAWYVMRKKDAITDAPETTLVTQDVTARRLARHGRLRIPLPIG